MGWGLASMGVDQPVRFYPYRQLLSILETMSMFPCPALIFWISFGFSPTIISSGLSNLTGNDAVELYENSSVIDVFGDINLDGTGQPWEYLRGWAYRNDSTGPDGVNFIQSNWTFSGINAFDMELMNADADPPFPIESYTGPGTGLVITGVIVGPTYTSRWLFADQGFPIGVLVDKSTLPTGITDQQALDALDRHCRPGPM